ncbi:MAG TPA: hypothetical protein VIH48_01625 [Candidatus Bathyarchaeia archaeon]
MKGILTEREKQFLQNPREPEPSNAMRRYYDSKITRKTKQTLEDLTLIFQHYDPAKFFDYDTTNMVKKAVERRFYITKREMERKRQRRKRKIDKRVIKRTVKHELDTLIKNELDRLTNLG